MKKFLSFALIAMFVATLAGCQSNQEEKIVTIETSMGNIVVKLYNDTPLHRDNFLKLVNEKFYDSLLFHRVINNFMIQGGDPETAGRQKLDYTIPAEFKKKHFHKKGTLSAARLGDNVNKKRESSPSQFYIVEGSVQTDEQLDQIENMIIQMNRAIKNKKTHRFSKAHREVYKTVGGAPHLDSQYTAFGEVVEGMDVVDKISNVQVNRAARPLENVYIIRAYEGQPQK